MSKVRVSEIIEWPLEMADKFLDMELPFYFMPLKAAAVVAGVLGSGSLICAFGLFSLVSLPITIPWYFIRKYLK